VCLAELLDFEMPALYCSVPGFKRKHVSINVMTWMFRNFRPCCAGGRGGARGGHVAQERGTAHQLTQAERECNLTVAMCLTLLPHASAADLADQPHKPHS
jgi:hypothetical protein